MVRESGPGDDTHLRGLRAGDCIRGGAEGPGYVLRTWIRALCREDGIEPASVLRLLMEEWGGVEASQFPGRSVFARSISATQKGDGVILQRLCAWSGRTAVVGGQCYTLFIHPLHGSPNVGIMWMSPAQGEEPGDYLLRCQREAGLMGPHRGARSIGIRIPRDGRPSTAQPSGRSHRHTTRAYADDVSASPSANERQDEARGSRQPGPASRSAAPPTRTLPTLGSPGEGSGWAP